MRDQLSTLLPVRPPVPEAAARGPLVPVDVLDDFTTWIPPKVPTPAHTFFAFAEPWLRPVREEDIGYLEHEHDDSATLVLPPLGPHYARVWAAEDTALHGAPLAGTAAAHAAPEPPLPDARARWEPATLADDDLVSGSRAHGPLTERLVAALIPAEQAWRGVKAAEEAMEGRSAGGTGAAAARDKLTVADIEDRVRGAMLGLGLVEEQVRVLARLPAVLADPRV
jgi:transcriptional adapter 3